MYDEALRHQKYGINSTLWGTDGSAVIASWCLVYNLRALHELRHLHYTKSRQAGIS